MSGRWFALVAASACFGGCADAVDAPGVVVAAIQLPQGGTVAEVDYHFELVMLDPATPATYFEKDVHVAGSATPDATFECRGGRNQLFVSAKVTLAGQAPLDVSSSPTFVCHAGAETALTVPIVLTVPRAPAP